MTWLWRRIGPWTMYGMCVAGTGLACEYVPEEDHETVMSESMLMGEAYCSWQQVNYRRETNRTTWFLLVPTS